MRKQIFCGLLVFLLLIVCGCSNYRKTDILGKTAQQITAQYGEFSLVDVSFISKDSSYRGIGSGYTVRPSRVGFLETEPEVLYFIVFDKNGKASACYEGYHLNGG